MEKWNISEILFNISIALLGGLVKGLMSKKKMKKLTYFVSTMIIGGFAGVLTYMLCKNFNFSGEMTAFAVGVAGCMGENILDLFSTWLPKLLGGKINININEENDDHKKGDKQND